MKRLLAAAFLLGACASPSEPAPVMYGTAMAEVARRFEQLGRAGAAGRYELAAYQLGEIEEAFEETLPHASPPHEGHPEVLPALAHTYAEESLPALRDAIATHDAATFTVAFARAATACNACHQASGHAFIEVPLVPGRSIPNTDPQ